MRQLRTLFAFVFLVMSFQVLGKGYDEHYEVKSGDFNGDGQVDLYVSQQPRIVILHGDISTPIVLPPPVQPLLLQWTTEGRFDPIDTLSASQISQLNAWPATNISVVTGDINVDGYVDLILTEISDVILGALDQILFAPNDFTSAEATTRAMDSEFLKFFVELDQAIYDENVFDNNAPIVTTQTKINTTMYLPEYCATPEWVSENGPLDAQPAKDTIEEDALEDLNQRASDFLTNCNLGGLTVIHWDFVSVSYNIPVGSKDYSVFSSEAMEASEEVHDVLESGDLEEGFEVGAEERETLEDIFERIFGTGVFDYENDYGRTPFEVIMQNIGYLAQLGDAPTGLIGNCPSTPATVSHNVALAYFSSDFAGNMDLSSKITKVVTGSNIQLTANFTVGGVDEGIDFLINGLNAWQVCRTLPDGTTVQFNVNASKFSFSLLGSPDLEFLPKTGSDCVDEATPGGKVIYSCAGETGVKKTASAMHEFGHILGFRDAYITRKEPKPGYEEDIMAVPNGKIFPHHLHVLSQMY